MLCLNDPQCLARVCGTHVMVQPHGRCGPLVPEPYHHFATSGALHMDVWWLMFSRRRVDIDAKRALFVHLDQPETYNLTLGYVHPRPSATVGKASGPHDVPVGADALPPLLEDLRQLDPERRSPVNPIQRIAGPDRLAHPWAPNLYGSVRGVDDP